MIDRKFASAWPESEKENAEKAVKDLNENNPDYIFELQENSPVNSIGI